MRDRGIYVPGIEKLVDTRRENKAVKAGRRSGLEFSDKPQSVTVRNAVSRRHPPSDEVRQSRINFVVPLAEEDGAEVRVTKEDKPEIVLTTRDGSVVFDGEILGFDGVAGTERARLIVKLARALDWPAVIVEGDARSTDQIITAGVILGVTAINTCASEDALGLIKKRFGHLLADTVRPLDPLAVVDQLLAAYVPPAKVEPVDTSSAGPQSSEPAFDLEMRETLEPSFEESRWQDDVPWQDDPDELDHAELDDEAEPETDPNFDDDEKPEPDPGDA